jgi:hypothetical protein
MIITRFSRNFQFCAKAVNKIRTLIIEAVDPVDARALVVASKYKEVFRVFDLVGQQQANSLERLFSTVHVVAEEEIISFGREPAVLKQTQQVVVLSMNIACVN